MFISKEMCDCTSNCYMSFASDQSTVGIKPSEAAPASIATDIGDGSDFILVAVDRYNNLYYAQEFSPARLTLFND